MNLLTGVAIGAGLGLLFAPRSGRELRENITERAGELADNARETLGELRRPARRTTRRRARTSNRRRTGTEG
jgi:gas vesicle protein